MRSYLLSILALFISCLTLGQSGIDSHWHFGNGNGLDFSSGEPVLTPSSALTPIIVEPGTISDSSGNLILYTDGHTIYNSNGTAIENGSFEEPGIENIFSPIPEDPDRYYFFRSSPIFGTTWSIIDLNLNDGEGGINDSEKDIMLNDDVSQLMVTTHANMNDYWLVVADNNSGDGGMLRFTSFSITNAGLIQEADFAGTYSWATFFDSLEEARMSPTCIKIATSHKGHYVTLFEFDNSTGEVTTGFENSVNLPDGISTLNYIEFSANGDFLYVLADQNEVRRYDANTFNQVDFASSVETLFNINNGDLWTHIKRGPNGNIYLLNSQQLTLDELSNTESLSPNLIVDYLELGGASPYFFPNTTNSCFGPPTISSTNVCEGNDIHFQSFLNEVPDSMFWTIQNDQIQDTVFSESDFWSLYSVGEYDVEFHYLFDTLWTTIVNSSIVFEQPAVDLGPDIDACAGDTITLEAGSQPFNVLWNTSSTDNSITVINSGTFSVDVVNGLCTAFDEIEVNFTPEPSSYIPPVVICDEQIDVELDASGSDIDSYIWEDGTMGPLLTVSESGTYTVYVSNVCFTDSIDGSVNYIFFPDDLVDSIYTACGTDTVPVSSAYHSGSISWSNNDQGPIALIEGEGPHTIMINHLGCLASDEFVVERLDYIDAGLLIAPNVISPNDDDYNEVFRPFYPLSPSEEICGYVTLDVDVKIYNRWGRLIHSGACLWNGETENEELVSPGVYYYIMDLESECLDYESSKRVAGHFEVTE